MRAHKQYLKMAFVPRGGFIVSCISTAKSTPSTRSELSLNVGNQARLQTDNPSPKQSFPFVHHDDFS